jgi:hypothetical protein
MLTEPIVKGAYYEREDGCVIGPAKLDATDQDVFWIGRTNRYRRSRGGQHVTGVPELALTRRVYIVPTDPAEVVAELRGCQARATIIAKDNDNDPFRLGRETAWGNAADLVAEKLGVGNG